MEQTTEASVRDRAADVIEPHLTLKHRRHDHALGCADDLRNAGLLGEGEATEKAREAAVHILQCRQSWSVAEAMVAAVADAGMLGGTLR